MATDDSSTPAGHVALELVEILKRLEAHRRAAHEQTYGNPPWTREQSDAYWYHPLVRACEWLEQRVGISRHDLEHAAFRLTTPLGLRGMDPLTGPGGRTDAGQPDLLWMIPKFRELDQDGTTVRLWQSLVEKYPAILEEAGLPSGQPSAAYPGEAIPAAGGVLADERDNTIEQLRRGMDAFNDRQHQYEAGLERVSQAVQSVTPISETMKQAYLDAMTEHEQRKALQLPAPPESGNADGVRDPPYGFLSGEDLADALGVHPSRREAFFQQLLRKRTSLGDDCWHEVLNPRPNSPRFFYRADSSKLGRLAASYKTPKPA